MTTKMQERELAELGEVRSAMAPDPEAVRNYQVNVFSHVDDGDELDRELAELAWMLPHQVKEHVSTYSERVEYDRQLREDVPRMEEEARRLAAIESQDLGAVPLSSLRTIDDLIDAVDRRRMQRTPGVVLPEKLAAHQATQDARSAKATAVQGLVRTADPALAARIMALRGEIGILNSKIANREELLNIEARIVKQRAEVERWAAIAAGERERFATGGREDQLSASDVYREHRARLNDLLAMRGEVPKAEVEDRQDRARIVELEEEIGNLQERKLAPRNMRWAD